MRLDHDEYYLGISPNWNEMKLDTLQHKTVLKVIHSF